MDLKEISLDLAEYQRLTGSASRPTVQKFLQAEADRLSKIVQAEQAKLKAKENAPTSVEKKSYTVTLRTYSWDESDKFAKLYIDVPAMTPSDQSKISCTFAPKSLSLEVMDIEGKNYQLSIQTLAKEVNVEKSYCKAKKGMLVVFMNKLHDGEKWGAVTLAEAQKKEKEEKPDLGGDGKDPNDGIMSMMKKMYTDGDDKMKQMLNKTWYESQQKQAGGMPGGMGGMPGGMGGMPGGMGGMGGMSPFE